MNKFEGEQPADPYDVRLALDGYLSMIKSGRGYADLLEWVNKETDPEIEAAARKLLSEKFPEEVKDK